MLDHLFGVFVNELSEIFDQSVVFVKESNHGVWKTDGQIALKNNTIETFDTSLDVVLKKLYKGVHGVSEERSHLPFTMQI